MYDIKYNHHLYVVGKAKRTIYDGRHTVYHTGACKLTGEVSVQNYWYNFNSTSVYRYSNILKFNATAPCSNNLIRSVHTIWFKDHIYYNNKSIMYNTTVH